MSVPNAMVVALALVAALGLAPAPANLNPVLACRQALGNAHQAYWIVETSAARCAAEKAKAQAASLPCWPPLDTALAEIRTAKPIFEEARRTTQPAQNALVRDGNAHLALAGEALNQADACLRQASRDVFSSSDPPRTRPAPAPPPPAAPPQTPSPGGGWEVREYPQIGDMSPLPPPPVARRRVPTGTLTGSMTWDEWVFEGGRRIHRQGTCALDLQFLADGTLALKRLEYTNTDTTEVPQYGQVVVERLGGAQPPKTYASDLRITQAADGTFAVSFQNPVMQLSAWNETHRLTPGRPFVLATSKPFRSRPGSAYTVHCMVGNLTSLVSLAGWHPLGPAPVITRVGRWSSAKPVQNAVLETWWNFRQ